MAEVQLFVSKIQPEDKFGEQFFADCLFQFLIRKIQTFVTKPIFAIEISNMMLHLFSSMHKRTNLILISAK
jgi:hypothetical protein